MTDPLQVEYLSKPQISKIKCLIFDYDGTLTTLRKGWEFILYPYVRGLVNKDHDPLKDHEVEEDLQYLVAHAGGTTPRQLMERVANLVQKYKGRSESVDFYIEDFGAIFSGEIGRRLSTFDQDSESYLIKGVRELLAFLKEQETINYVVTGSCDKAVRHELKKLSMEDSFRDVFGADLETQAGHKERAILSIMTQHALDESEVLIVGDGSTEMRAAVKYNLPALGVASDEHNGGWCAKKRQLMVDIGVHALVADYDCFADVWCWLHE